MIVTKPYDRMRAIEYARRWALDRNPLFLNFAGRGGDCTNFVSQCILAGSCTMDLTKDFGWYYINAEDRAPAWTSVEFFYDFITSQPTFAGENMGIGPFGYVTDENGITVGDVVQLADESGDFYHTLFIVDITNEGILVAAHTNDALDRPLSTYNYSSLRYIHIDGVHVEIGDDICFEGLIEGVAINVDGYPQNIAENMQ